jgi:uncharacterized protein (TIGR02284 family)
MYSENVEDVAATLQSLAQYEIDGSFIISQAMASISNTNIGEHLSEIREECERNIEELANLICEYGREAPDHSRDFKGFFMQGYTGMRGLLSDKGAMRALQTNLGLVAKAYEKALGSDLPSDVKEKLQALYTNVKDHLEYVTSQA